MSLTVLNFEDVEDWKNLAVVWNKRLSDKGCRNNKFLKHFECCDNNIVFSRVEGSYA